MGYPIALKASFIPSDTALAKTGGLFFLPENNLRIYTISFQFILFDDLTVLLQSLADQYAIND